MTGEELGQAGSEQQLTHEHLCLGTGLVGELRGQTALVWFPLVSAGATVEAAFWSGYGCSVPQPQCGLGLGTPDWIDFSTNWHSSGPG